MKKIIILVLIGLSLAFIIRTYLVESIFIASGSMEPTLHVNTNLYVNKLAYSFKKPMRGEIITFMSPREEKKHLVKRVIAIGGDEIEIKKKIVWVNDAKLDEDYVQHTRPDSRFKDDNLGPWIVPEGTVFVMGDNRDESNDSRNWVDSETGEQTPFITLEAIEGRIFGIY